MKRVLKYFFIAITTVCISCLIFYSLILPRMLPGEKMLSLAEKILPDEYDIKTKNFKPNFRWNLSLSLSADEFALLKEERPIFSSEKPSIRISLIPLINKQLVIKNFSADKIKISLAYPQDKDIFALIKKNKTEHKRITLKKLKIKKYILSASEDNKTSSIEGENLSISKYFWSEHYKISTSGRILADNKQISNFYATASKNKTDITVDKIDMSRIIPYINDTLPYDISNGEGTLGIHFDIEKNGDFNFKSQINNLFIYDKNKKQLLSIYDTLHITANGNMSSKQIKLEKLNAQSKDYNFSISGSVGKIDKKKKTYNLSLNTQNSKIKKLLGLFPKWIPVKNDAPNQMFLHNIKGRVTSNLIISADNEQYPNYYGQLSIENLSIDNFGNEDSILILNFNEKELKLNADLFQKKQDIHVEGIMRVLPEKFIEFDVKTNTVKLNALRAVTTTLSEIFGFAAGPLPDMTMNGTGRAYLHIKNKNTDIKKAAQLNGKVEILSATNIRHKDLALPVDTATGEVFFKGNKIEYDLNGVMKLSPLKVTGYSSIPEEKSYLTLSTKSTPLDSGLYLINNSPLLSKAKENLKLIKQANGTADLTIFLTGKNETEFTASGNMKTKNASVLLEGFSKEFTNIASDINFDEQTVTFNNITATAADSSFTANGTIKNQQINLTLKAPNLDASSAFELIKTSPALKSAKDSMKDIKSLSGKMNSTLVLKGAINSDNLLDTADFNILNGNIIFNDFNENISLTKGNLHISKNNMTINSVEITVLGTKGTASGEIATENKQNIPNITVTLPYASHNAIIGLRKADYIPKEVRQILADTHGIRGSASAKVKIQNTDFAPDIVITPNNLRVIYKPANAPIRFTSGTLHIDKNYNTKFNNISGYMGSSRFHLRGGADSANNLDIKLFSILTPQDLQNHLNKMLKSPLALKKNAPVSADFKGNYQNWHLIGEMILNEGNTISYKDTSIEAPKTRFLFANISKDSSGIKISNTGIRELSSGTFAHNCYSTGCYSKYKTSNVLKIDGLIKNKKGRISLSAPNHIDIDLLNAAMPGDTKIFDYGKVRGNIDIVLDNNTNKILGHLNIHETFLPSVQTLIQNADITFTQQDIKVKNCKIKIDESDIDLNITGKNSPHLPFVLKEVTLTSNYMNLDDILDKYLNKTTVKEGDKPLFIIEKGTLKANEFVLNNLITNNTDITFNFDNNWMLNLDKIYLNTAGGNINGNMNINVKTSDIQSVLYFENMLANAAATTFFQIPNEIYGTMSGQLDFTTKGTSPEEFVKNSNGNGSFKITDGRLVRLGSMEYLLRAANIAQAGITGLNLNNLIDLFTPQKTGHFDTISLDVRIQNGILHTDNLISKSQNLNLYIMGSFDMETNYADLTVLGRLPKKIKGVLGPIGSLSINSMLDMIPGVDALTESNLAAIIPILNKIPGFELDNKEYRRFVVNIEGDFYNPGSVKKFRWLK